MHLAPSCATVTTAATAAPERAMAMTVRGNGEYELFEDGDGRRVLVLDGRDTFAWLDGDGTERLVRSQFDEHAKQRTLQNGEFYLVEFDGAERGRPHLFLQKDDGFSELVLPDGLPSRERPEKSLVALDEAGLGQRLMIHLAR
jgi:hypothetical protein